MAARSTWEISAAIPVLYTHQKAVKRPSFKEGILRLSAGRATLCDSSGKVLDAETVTSSLLAQLKNQEELDFPGHLLQPDPTLEISVPSLPTEPEPSPSRRRGQTCLGVKPFKRPRTQPRSLSSFSTASSAAHSLPRPGRDEQDLSGALSAPSTVKNLGDESKATPTPCRQRLDLQGAGTRFRPPRPAPKWRDESEFKPNGPGLPGQREAFAPDHQEAEALALALRRAEAAPEQAEAQVLELCRQEVHTFRRAHLELDQQEEEAQVLERQQEEARHMFLSASKKRHLRLTSSGRRRQRHIFLSASKKRHLLLTSTGRQRQRHIFLSASKKRPGAAKSSTSCSEAVALDQQWQAQALQQRRSYALQEEQALELRQQEAHDAACQAQQRQPEAPALEPALQRQNEAFVLNPQQAEELRQQQERAIEEALAWERQAQAKPHGEALDRREQEDEDESGPQEDMEDEPESEAALSPDEEDLPLMEVMAKQEEDLPLAEMVAAQAKAHQRPPRKAKAKTPVVPLKLPLSFGSVPESAPREDLSAEAGYAAYFEHLLVSEMQRRLGALASGAEKPSLVASGVMLGAAKDDGGLAVLLFSRAKILQGDLGCAQNDLWAVRLGREGGPEILLRALWKGVTPKGRLLCAPVNQAASEYLESHRSRRLCTTSLTLCCGAFGELLQVGALRADPKRAAVLQSTSPASASLPELPELQGLSEEQREVALRVAAWCDGAQGCVPVRGVFGSGKSRTLAACIVLLDRRACLSTGTPR
ncbi:unnamed protein product [Effrenium voratum]|nr:unnamed protein product [Effrenium voratum]